MIDIIIFIVLLTIVSIALSIAFPSHRPLIAGIVIVYLSLPIYLFIASLSIDYRLRIALQLLTFVFLMFLALYIIFKEYRKAVRIHHKVVNEIVS